MSANNYPIYSREGEVSTDGTTAMGPTLTTGSDTYTGTNAANTLVFTADATNGSFVQRLRFKPIGSNTATVARIFINNGASATVAGNNHLYGEQTLQATTASAVAALVDVDYPLNYALPAGFKIYVQLATTVASGWVVSAIAGNY